MTALEAYYIKDLSHKSNAESKHCSFISTHYQLNLPSFVMFLYSKPSTGYLSKMGLVFNIVSGQTTSDALWK